MTHTPTPWVKDPYEGHVTTSLDRFIASAMSRQDGREQTRVENLANADRIVACVNFFHGRDIPTEQIEEGQFWAMVDALHAARLAFTRIQNEGDAHSNAVATKALSKLGIEP